MSITGLERELHQYTLEPSETSFDLKSVPLAAESVVDQQPTAAAAAAAAETAAVKATTDKLAATRHDVYAGQTLLCRHLTTCVCVCICLSVWLCMSLSVCLCVCEAVGTLTFSLPM